MAEGLPEGLVRNREGVTAVGEGVDNLDAELVATCWRSKPPNLLQLAALLTVRFPVYSSKKAVLAENIGRRLENFFWRIWGSERLRQRLSGTQVNIQFDIINEGGYIRTTPTASPRSSKSLSAYYKEVRQRTPPVTPSASESSNQPALFPVLDDDSTERASIDKAPLSHPSVPRDSSIIAYQSDTPASEESGDAQVTPSYVGLEDSSVTPTPTSPIAALEKSSESSKENRRSPQIPTRRPPILKKEGSSGSSRSSRSAKISGSSNEATSADDDPNIPTQARSASSRRPTATRFNEEVAVSIPKPSMTVLRNAGERSARPGGESSQRSGRRNPVVVASTAANKTRPAFVRQRSSTGASRDVLSKSLSNQHLARSPRTLATSTSTGFRSIPGSKQSPEPSSTRTYRAASPHSSRQPRQQVSRKPSTEGPVHRSSADSDEPNRLVEVSAAKSSSNPKITTEVSRKKAGTLKPLVEPDFRAKFIDKTRASQRSLTDLSAFAPKSSAAVPTSASYQATGMMESAQATSSAGRGKGREAFTNVTAPLKAPAPAGREAGSEDNTASLPRTKSQLTLLLEKEKVRSAKEQERET